ncbi:MAG: L,D-transpeptidase family protein, partial [Wenzhouxiangella sp.]|nr:L,D-transpeptidase family protein [Wenzhouxiangella sp.]
MVTGRAGIAPALADSELRERLRHRVESLPPGELIAAGQLLQAAEPLSILYEGRGWQPIWFDDRGAPTPLQAQLFAAIDLAYRHGLVPAHYHRSTLADLLQAVNGVAPAAVDRRVMTDIELLASDALISLSYHLLHGRVDPETIDPGWMIQRPVPDLFERLAGAGQDGPVDLVALIDGLAPAHPDYRALVRRLAFQRSLNLANSREAIPAGPLLRPGERDPRVPAIRQRLMELGDFRGSEPDAKLDPESFDTELQAAVRVFQSRHGLTEDGVVGPRTLAELNTQPMQRIEQLRANLERWRWLPRELGDEYILVNIAGFDMVVHSDGERVMTQRVVVGTPFRRTPVFTGRMTYLVLNPSWEVPHRLAVQDQLPRIRADLGYLDRMGFSVLQGWGADERRIDPADIDWQSLSRSHFPYRLRQAPGPENALGRVKFMFPNRHNVYLHDTPSRGLFARDERAFSSGCIRVEDPDRLTRWLLTERAPVLAPERINAILESGHETTVRLDRALPVHLLYWTAWIDGDGQVQYRRDIYQRDQALVEALNSPNSPNEGS